MLIKFETTVKESAIRFRTIKVEGLADELVPIADGDNPELLLHSLDRFNWLIKTVYNDMEVDDAVNRYTHCLGGTYYREWIRTEQNEDLPNVYSFEDYQKSFLRRIFDPEERENLIDLIMNPPTKKPKQTVAQYCARLEELRVYAHMLPGTDKTVSDDDFKKALVRGMPRKWQETFSTVKTLSQESLPSIKKFFDNQADISDRHYQERQNNDKKRKRDPPNARGGRNQNRGYNRGGRARYNDRYHRDAQAAPERPAEGTSNPNNNRGYDRNNDRRNNNNGGRGRGGRFRDGGRGGRNGGRGERHNTQNNQQQQTHNYQVEPEQPQENPTPPDVYHNEDDATVRASNLPPRLPGNGPHTPSAKPPGWSNWGQKTGN